MDLTEQAIEKLLATGRGQNALVEPGDGDAYCVTPQGTLLDLAGRYPPTYIRQTVTLLNAASFTAYVNRFKTMDSLLFANVTDSEATLTAILDYHALGKDDHHAQRCAHRAVFTTKATAEWKVWLAANRKAMNQVEFATWLEDNANLFVSPEGSGAPSGGELLELVRSLHGHQNARFNTNLRLNTGAYSVAYEEEVEVKGSLATKPGSLELPPIIMGGFSIFEGAAAYQVPARLKTRISDRRLVLFFETIALAKLIRESVDAIVAQVAEQTKIVPLIGTPN
jgi:uncharacterized protein YfdQ (DUF2303 family)